MIREELLHPAVSHFPIALLVLLVVVKVFEIFTPKKYIAATKNLELLSKFLLISGSLFLIPSLFLGDIALDIVKSTMKNITLAYHHEELAHNALYIFIFVLVLDLLPFIKPIPKAFSKSYQIVILLFIIWGNYYIFKTAHSGASLVYDYGTAVQVK